jgi:transcriptional regulator with XRE-family HTH domain
MGFNKEKLRAQLRAASRSGAWLARRIGVTPASISYYLNGKRVPEGEKVEAMAKNLECSVEFLTSEAQDPSASQAS